MFKTDDDVYVNVAVLTALIHKELRKPDFVLADNMFFLQPVPPKRIGPRER